MKTTKLKSCPFCGGNTSDPSQVKYSDGLVTYCYCIVCMECEAYMEMDTREEVIAAWNKRCPLGDAPDNKCTCERCTGIAVESLYKEEDDDHDPAEDAMHILYGPGDD